MINLNVDPSFRKREVFTRNIKKEQKKVLLIFSFKDGDHSPFPLFATGTRHFRNRTSMRFARATRLFVRVSLKNTETNGTEITDREREITETKEETEEHAGRWLSELHTTPANRHRYSNVIHREIWETNGLSVGKNNVLSFFS